MKKCIINLIERLIEFKLKEQSVSIYMSGSEIIEQQKIYNDIIKGLQNSEIQARKFKK